MKEFNVVLTGVGGQGILLAAEILGVAAVKEHLNVRVSEVHGMAQRGGAVTSSVRIGEAALSPTVMDGQADVLVGFEPLETLRNLKFVSEKTLIVMSDERIPPTEFAFKNVAYPSVDDIVKKIKCFGGKVITVDTEGLADKAGNPLTRNIVLVGALAGVGKLPLKTRTIKEAIRELVPARHVETNLKAFEFGLECARKRC